MRGLSGPVKAKARPRALQIVGGLVKNVGSRAFRVFRDFRVFRVFRVLGLGFNSEKLFM